MGNVIRREKLQKTKSNQNRTVEGLKYRSIFGIGDLAKGNKEENNNKRPVIKDDDNVNSLINMVHDNVFSRKLSFKGPFGRRRCKFLFWKNKNKQLIDNTFLRFS